MPPNPLLDLPVASPIAWDTRTTQAEVAIQSGPQALPESIASAQPVSNFSHRSGPSRRSLCEVSNDETGKASGVPFRQQQPSIDKTPLNPGSPSSSHQSYSETYQLRCSQCGKSVKRPTDLARHMTEQHGNRSESLPCPHNNCNRGQGGKGFKRKEHLNNHLHRCHRTNATSVAGSGECIDERAEGRVLRHELGQRYPSGSHPS